MNHIDLMIFIKHQAYAMSNSSLNTGGQGETARPGPNPVAQDKKPVLSGWSGRWVKYLYEWIRRKGMARQKVPALFKEVVFDQLQ